MSDEVNEIQEIQSGIVKILQDDIEFCAPFIETDQKGAQNQQFWRRTYIRTFMARVEGTSNAFKDVALRIARIMQTTLTPAELALLKDEHYQLNDKGQAQSTKAKIRTEANIKFALHSFAKAHGITFSLAVDDGWRELVETIRVRDRLTHPRTTADLNVSFDEILRAMHAHAWFLNQIAACTSQATPALEAFRKRISTSGTK